MRADRLATVYFFAPVQRVLGRGTAGIPILMYHRVPAEDACSTHPYYCTSTAVDVFERQIAFLRRSGYRGVSVTEAFELAQTGRDGEKRVAITFDDGYEDFLRNAFPVLSRYGYSATVYLPTAYIGDSSRDFKGAGCLTWSQVRELRRAGIEFGSHTVTHPQLRDVGHEQLEREVRDSKREIEDRLGEPAESFAYPYAFPESDRGFVARFRDVLGESGYRSGVSTILGRAGAGDNPLYMKRLPANTHDDPSFFQAKLEGGYNWLHSLQYAAKQAKARRNPPQR